MSATPEPVDRALDVADEATAIGARLVDALTRISEILPPAGHPATAGQVTRVRAVIAGLDRDRSEASAS